MEPVDAIRDFASLSGWEKAGTVALGLAAWVAGMFLLNWIYRAIR